MTVHLKSGNHSTRAEGMCAMEAASYLAGEPHSDHPECVSPVIAAFMIGWNDGLPSDAERDRLLKPLIPLTLHTRTTKADDLTRSWMALDWLVRVHTAAWLDAAKLTDHANTLRNLPALTSLEICLAVQSTIDAAWDAARAAAGDAAGTAARDAAWDAARDAARAAAGDAAGTAAGDAARAAAGDAARDAAWDAARAAAGDAARDAAWDAAGAAARAAARAPARAAARAAAWDAAGDALAPTVASLQESAADLVKRMCAVGEVKERRIIQDRLTEVMRV